jgi:hypothetical protein
MDAKNEAYIHNFQQFAMVVVPGLERRKQVKAA